MACADSEEMWEVGDGFFGADDGEDFVVGEGADVVSAVHGLGDGCAEFGGADGLGVAGDCSCFGEGELDGGGYIVNGGSDGEVDESVWVLGGEFFGVCDAVPGEVGEVEGGALGWVNGVVHVM